jgi:hypothetical protein
LSPLLANLLLDGLDRELERRGHQFVRYADDCNLYVKSARAGQRVLASVTRFWARRLKLPVNSGLYVHRASAEPAPGERKGPEGVQAGGAPEDVPDTRGLADASRG